MIESGRYDVNGYEVDGFTVVLLLDGTIIYHRYIFDIPRLK